VRITGQIGNWYEGLAVKFDAVGLSWLDARGTDRHVRLSVTAARKVVVSPEPEGLKVGRHNAYYQDGEYTHATKRCPAGASLPRFELTEVSFFEDGGVLVTTLPPDHALSWPKVRPCEGYDCREVVIAELERRLRSALQTFEGDQRAAGRAMTPMPETLRALLRHGDWPDAVRRASDRSTW